MKNIRKLNHAFARAMEQGKGRDDTPNAYTFMFKTKKKLDGQPFEGATINPIVDTIYTARSNRAGVEAMLKDDSIVSMELSRTVYATTPKP